MSNPLADVVAGARRDLELQWARDEQRDLELTQAEKWARDPLCWIDEHAWIASKFDESGNRVRVRPLKMRLFPDQQRTIREWIDLDQLARTGELRFGNVLVEKSRQIGETWALAAVVTWLLHYHRTRGLFMHTRAAEVADRGWTIDSFFGRVKYIDQRLDRARIPGLRELTFRPFSTDPALIAHLPTGAMVRGECQRDDPGRGSTFDWAIVDEAAHVQHGEAVHAAIDDACPTGKVYLSTPEGDDNVHARLCDQKPKGYTYLRLHWANHPVYGRGAHVAGDDPDCHLCAGTQAGLGWDPADPKAHRYPGRVTSPWYDQAVIGKTDEQVAQELDIDRERALTARVYPEFSTPVHVVAEGIEIELDDLGRPAIPFELAFDFGLDATSVPVLQNAPGEVRVIGLLEMGDLFGTTATPERVAEQLRLLLQELGMSYIETTPDFTRHLRAVGDPSGQYRQEGTARPLVSQYRRQGFNIQRPPARLTKRVDLSVIAVKRMLAGTPKPLRICGQRAPEMAAHFRNNVWPTNQQGHRQLGVTQPLDNVHNHACRAVAYWTLATFPPPDERTQHPPTSDPEQPVPHLPLTERRRRAMRRVTAGGDLDDDLPFAGGGAL